MAKQKPGVYDRVLECAKDEFLSKGFLDASLRAIAQEAGTSTCSIYTRFGDKEGLFRAIVEPVVDQFKATLSEKDMIRSIMSEEKANQRETVKIPSEKLRKFAPNANPQQLEDFVLKACEHYRKYLRRQRDAR